MLREEDATVKRILSKIAEAKEGLPQGKLFRWLADEGIDGAQRLSFAPDMLYYLMGFKDVLEALYRPQARERFDRAINAYCGEDAEHWRWYLSDLEILGYDLTTWGVSIPEWCNNVWSPENRCNRQTIFELVGFARACRDPLYALSLIQVFEATGVVFIGHTRKAAIALEMDDTLQYFGRTHYEEEFGHSVQGRDFEGFTMSDEVFLQADHMVDTLFKAYSLLFDCWYEHRDRYRSTRSAAVNGL